MKKFLSALLALSLLFTLPVLSACDDEVEEKICRDHIDENGDDKCDKCQSAIPCKEHKDTNYDNKCDRCGSDMACLSHVDSNSDSLCDKCGEIFFAPGEGVEGPIVPID